MLQPFNILQDTVLNHGKVEVIEGGGIQSVTDPGDRAEEADYAPAMRELKKLL